MREQLIIDIAKIVCHCDGHIWLSKLDGHVCIGRQALQHKYLNTAESILNLIEKNYVVASPELTAENYIPKKYRRLNGSS